MLHYWLVRRGGEPRRLDARLEHFLHRLLSAPDEAGGGDIRLVDDGRRLWRRVQRFIAMNLVGPEVNLEALELACHALQLPLRYGKLPPAGRMGQMSLKDRAEQSAELMINMLAERAEPQVLDHAAQILRQLPRRDAALSEARLLADAVNLDDFGVVGLFLQAMHLARQHAGIAQLIEGYDKRREYGYWEARLKDGFHFDAVREMARKRMASAQRAVELLKAELSQDEQPPD